MTSVALPVLPSRAQSFCRGSGGVRPKMKPPAIFTKAQGRTFFTTLLRRGAAERATHPFATAKGRTRRN
jgi:hypothetical protein